jgi:hypothetical protein
MLQPIDNSYQVLALIKQGLRLDEVAEAMSMTVEDLETMITRNPQLRGEVEKFERRVARKEAEKETREAITTRLDAKFAEMEDLVFNAFRDILEDPDTKSGVRARVAEYIADQLQGRHKQKETVGVVTVVDFNSLLVEARRRKEELEAKLIGDKTGVVDVETVNA